MIVGLEEKLTKIPPKLKATLNYQKRKFTIFAQNFLSAPMIMVVCIGDQNISQRKLTKYRLHNPQNSIIELHRKHFCC